jgi:hypothetical protein
LSEEQSLDIAVDAITEDLETQEKQNRAQKAKDNEVKHKARSEATPVKAE